MLNVGKKRAVERGKVREAEFQRIFFQHDGKGISLCLRNENSAPTM